MTTVPFATSPGDSRALEVIEDHHAELVGALAARVATLVAAVQAGGPWREDRDALTEWCRQAIAPHLEVVMSSLSTAGLSPRLELLVRSLRREHDLLTGRLARMGAADDAPVAMLAAGALQALLESHLAKQDELLLPALAVETGSSVAELLEAMRVATDSADADEPGPTADTTACGCHDEHNAAVPELDARTIPHAVRHATVFGALDAVALGGMLDLVAPHDPIPLLAQLEERAPNAFAIDYIERGPDAWRLRFTRHAGLAASS